MWKISSGIRCQTTVYHALWLRLVNHSQNRCRWYHLLKDMRLSCSSWRSYMWSNALRWMEIPLRPSSTADWHTSFLCSRSQTRPSLSSVLGMKECRGWISCGVLTCLGASLSPCCLRSGRMDLPWWSCVWPTAACMRFLIHCSRTAKCSHCWICPTMVISSQFLTPFAQQAVCLTSISPGVLLLKDCHHQWYQL